MEITKDNVMIARPLERLIEVGLGDVFLNVLKSYEDRILEVNTVLFYLLSNLCVKFLHCNVC